MEVTQKYTDKSKRDYDLVQRALENDQQAYAELLGLYQDSLYFMLYKMVKNKDDAEDLTIEAFSKAFNRLEAYRPSFAFSTWLFKIASNNCIDFLRTNKNSKKNVSIDNDKKGTNQELANESFHIKEKSMNPEERLIDFQKEQILRSIVKKLHPDYSRIVKLRYFDDLSYNEISEKLKIPLGTVKARLFRSKELMHGMLKKHENHL